MAALGSIDEALLFLEKCVRDEAMDEILVPIIEHVFRKPCDYLA